jgi:predicted DNA binding CopG/RHH family protein
MKTKKYHVSIRMPFNLIERVKLEAKEENITVTELIIRAIKNYLKID